MKKMFHYLCLLLLPLAATTQVTTGNINGMVRSGSVILAGASIKAIHEPTGTTYFSQSGKTGNYTIQNLAPGGPYIIEVSFINHTTEKKKDFFIALGENKELDFALALTSATLQQVVVRSKKKTNDPYALSNTIDQNKMAALPTVGRNLYDYLRSSPQAKLIPGNEGAVSFAGQNNRYNSFYIDGSVHNDVYGLSASGTNGGQAAISPLSMDAIDQLQVAVTPYDASLGNFTGAAINAVTRSGGNRKESSLYYFFSNKNLAGKTPTGAKENAVRLDDFFTRTYGLRTQGAILQNKLFYFINIELQRERYTQPFLFNTYKGDTRNAGVLSILSNTLKGTYHYDPGNYADNTESVNADRIVSRFDWNINQRNTISISNRYTYAQRMHSNASNATTINFSNNGYALFSRTQSVSLEWKTSVSYRSANKLLLTYTNVKDDREPLFRAFPRVRINDGDGAFIFGTDNSSTINLLTQKNWTLFDKYNFTAGNHSINAGVDLEYNQLFNAFIQNSFGSYTYYSVDDFLTNSKPTVYQYGFSMIDNLNSDRTTASAKIQFAKTAVFINDELRYNRLVMYFGIRIDQSLFLNTPAADDYTNTVAIPAFARYWEIDGARSGAPIKVPPVFSPRVGFMYRPSQSNITFRGGVGVFSGRMPLVWPGGAYNNNGSSIGGFIAGNTQLSKIRFRADPYHQWTPADFGVVPNKAPLNLVAEKLSMPRIIRTSLALDKKINTDWSAGMECMFSKNLVEIKYTNINVLPPVTNAVGPDKRFVYASLNNAKIPLNADSSNPYDYAILLGNNKISTGYAYDLSATINGRFLNGWRLEMNYHFGHSIVNNEGTSSVNVSQWRLMETVNGRNFLTPSVSDFNTGHRLFAMLNKTFTYHDRAMRTDISLVYTAQSGSPVSYVYGNTSMTRDDGLFSAYDLIYIPSTEDLNAMVFLPNLVNGNTYSAAQQKEMFESYIQNDRYLRTHRGSYAERNGSRTPFTHIVDIRIKHNIRIGRYEVQLTCDLFNVTNFLNRAWGRRYDQPFDTIALIDFAGYTAPDNLTPQYRFSPVLLSEEKWKVSATNTPAYSARWSAQLGLRLTLK